MVVVVIPMNVWVVAVVNVGGSDVDGGEGSGGDCGDYGGCAGIGGDGSGGDCGG